MNRSSRSIRSNPWERESKAAAASIRRQLREKVQNVLYELSVLGQLGARSGDKKKRPRSRDQGRFGKPETNYSFFSVSSKDCVPAPPLTSTSALTLL